MTGIWVNLLPLSAAVLYGLAYALFPVLTRSVPIPAFMLISAPVTAVIYLMFSAGSGGVAALSQLTWQQITLAALLPVLSSLAWITTIYAIDRINPTYAAVGEIAYVLFVPLFGWLIFKDAKLDIYTIIAAVLILAGSAVLIYGKTANTAGAIDAHL